MPAASCGLPRQMLPPPTTTAIETPSACTAAFFLAFRVVVTPPPPPPLPANASPESFSRTRRKAGAGTGLLAECELGEAANGHLLAEHARPAIDQLAARHRIVLDERFLEHHVVLEPLVELAFDDFLRDRRRLAVRNLLDE